MTNSGHSFRAMTEEQLRLFLRWATQRGKADAALACESELRRRGAFLYRYEAR